MGILSMRIVLALALGACLVGPVRSAVQPKLSELPSEREQRNAILDHAYSEPTPEQKKPLPSALRRIETIAATAATLIGIAFSKRANVTFGSGVQFEESPTKKQPRREEKADKPPKLVVDTPAELVPWVRIGRAEDH